MISNGPVFVESYFFLRYLLIFEDKSLVLDFSSRYQKEKNLWWTSETILRPENKAQWHETQWFLKNRKIIKSIIASETRMQRLDLISCAWPFYIDCVKPRAFFNFHRPFRKINLWLNDWNIDCQNRTKIPLSNLHLTHW